MNRKLKAAILISGRGSNMQALIAACAAESYPVEIGLVVANKAEAPGLDKARQQGIATQTLLQKDYTDRSGFEKALHNILIQNEIEIVCLAGFMRILGADFVENWAGRIVNIHPSLLPDYPGLDTYARALADGRDESGCTVHYVIPEMDAGEIILQRRVPVLPGDSPDDLAQRILAEEHIAYPAALRIVAEKLLKSGDRKR